MTPQQLAEKPRLEANGNAQRMETEESILPRQALLVGTLWPEGAASLAVGQTICRYNLGISPCQREDVSVPGDVSEPYKGTGTWRDKGGGRGMGIAVGDLGPRL